MSDVRTEYFDRPNDERRSVRKSYQSSRAYKCGRNYKEDKKAAAPSPPLDEPKFADNGPIEENWDLPEGGGQAVSVLEHVKREILEKPVIRCIPIGLTKSQRKEFRKQEVERHRRLSTRH